MGFLNPLLLWALPLAAVPVIIHLLNRRRFQTVRWAAMEYLLAAMKRNRRRLQMQHWLVLLLRTLAVLLLVFLVSRPQSGDALLGGGTVHHVVCIDDSLSMAQRSGSADVFRNARDRVRAIAEELVEDRPGDVLTLFRASEPQRPVLSRVPVDAGLRQRLREALDAMRVAERRADPAAAIRGMRDHLAGSGEAARARLHLVTDLRRVDWLAADGTHRQEMLSAIEGLDPREQPLTVVAVGPRDDRNAGVSAIGIADRMAIMGVPLSLTVEVTNFGSQRSEPGTLTLEVGERSRVDKPLPALEPGASATLDFRYTFHTPGFHGVRAVIPADRYPVDDRRALALQVREASRVLLVDGDPGVEPAEAETFYLAAALDPAGESSFGIAPLVITEDALSRQDLDGFSMVWLCNVPAPDAAAVERLTAFVAAGGGLAIWVGDQVDVAGYNELLWRDGDGLLPAPLIELAGDPDEPSGASIVAPDHPVFAPLVDGLDELFASMVQIGRYLVVHEDPTRPVQVLLRIGGPNGPPLLLHRRFAGGGDVYLCTTTVDDAWTNWPRDLASLTYLPVHHEMHRYAARHQDLSTHDHGTDGVHVMRIDAARYELDVALTHLAEDGATVTFTADRPGEDGIAALSVPMTELRGLGLHRVVLQPRAGGHEIELVSRNPPLREGELTPVTGGELSRQYPESFAERVTVVGAGAAATAGAPEGELWRGIGIALLAILLLETLLAWRFGRR